MNPPVSMVWRGRNFPRRKGTRLSGRWSGWRRGSSRAKPTETPCGACCCSRRRRRSSQRWSRLSCNRRAQRREVGSLRPRSIAPVSAAACPARAKNHADPAGVAGTSMRRQFILTTPQHSLVLDTDTPYTTGRSHARAGLPSEYPLRDHPAEGQGGAGGGRGAVRPPTTRAAEGILPRFEGAGGRRRRCEAGQEPRRAPPVQRHCGL